MGRQGCFEPPEAGKGNKENQDGLRESPDVIETICSLGLQAETREGGGSAISGDKDYISASVVFMLSLCNPHHQGWREIM